MLILLGGCECCAVKSANLHQWRVTCVAIKCVTNQSSKMKKTVQRPSSSLPFLNLKICCASYSGELVVLIGRKQNHGKDLTFYFNDQRAMYVSLHS